MISLRMLTAALALALPLAAPAQAQNQRAALSGTTSGLAWSVYGPLQLGQLDQDRSNLRVSVHPSARVLGVKYDDRTITVAMRVNAPLRTVYTFHDTQLRQQGFNRTSQSLDEGSGRAVYTRDNDTLELRLDRQPNNVYRATLDLSGVQAGSMGMASGQMNNGQMNGQANPGQINAAPLLQDTPAGRLGYILYGPGVSTAQLRNDPSTLRVSVPAGATVINSSKEDEDLLVTMRSNLSLAQIDAFYREQFTRQGFTALAGADTETDKLSAVYTRSQNRVEWSAEREGTNVYQVLFNFEGARDGNAVSGASSPVPLALANPPVPTGVNALVTYPHGAYRYEFYGPYRLGAATNANVVRLATPPGSAEDVQINREGGGVRVLFEANMTLPEVYNFYSRQFAGQNFTLVGDRKAEADKIAATFRRGEETVGFNVEREGGTPTNTNYDVFFDFTP